MFTEFGVDNFSTMNRYTGCFHKLIDTENIALPERLNNPFYYQPSPLGLRAFSMFESQLLNRKDIQQYFENSDIGKMLGLLVVQNASGALGYLAAFSGKLGDTTQVSGFVPPVYDTYETEGVFKVGDRKLSSLTQQIENVEQKHLAPLKASYKAKFSAQQLEIEGIKSQIKLDKAKRDTLRSTANEETLKQLDQESAKQQMGFKSLKKKLALELASLQADIDIYEQQVQALKSERKSFSQHLQEQIFSSYQFLNGRSESKDLLHIFRDFGIAIPPSGAGECAAPKLLHFAFQHALKPIELLEFWWGQASPSQIRVQGKFYPSCRSKCEPILKHMLQGCAVEAMPKLTADERLENLEILYQDAHLAAINKPHDVLSVPGKVDSPSVADYLRKLFPNAEQPILVHRLDRATSGVLLVAMNQKIYVDLQAQFMNRSVKKKYIALLDGVIEQKSGRIHLPLRVDLDNRPQQLVCFEHGLEATTRFEVLEVSEQQTRIAFYPITGRTHQLRVHAAHPLGLNVPILGDDLYGTPANRLHLHANTIRFTHPVTGKMMNVQSRVEF